MRPLPVFLALVLLPSSAFAGTSALWGAWGERWDAAGRLPDFRYAGYQAGEAEIPEVPVTANLLDFGAVADGETDASGALRQAIDEMEPGALLIPAGRWAISEQVVVRRSDIVLRGEGSGTDGTSLVFPNSLADQFGARVQWSWNGGLIELRPPDGPVAIGAVTEPAVRGETRLTVAGGSTVTPGDFIRLVLHDDEAQTLGSHLHADQTERGECSWQETFQYAWTVQVAAVEGEVLVLAQPLRTDVRPEWTPEVTTAAALREVGIEHLRFEFPEVPYAGHHSEPGYNGIFATGGLVDSWVRDVVIVNADNGVLLDHGSKRVTLQDLVLEGRSGHHGLQLAFSHDCLVQRVLTSADWIHAGTVDHRSSGNVWRQLSSSAGPWEMDHHRDSSIENLWTAIGTEASWASSGSPCAGTHSGARSTFWGLERVEGVPVLWGFVQANVVGMLTVEEERSELGAWYEHVPDLQPADLYEAQRERAAGLADRTGAFAEGLLGRREAWTEDDPDAWLLTGGAYGNASLVPEGEGTWTMSEGSFGDGLSLRLSVRPAPRHDDDPLPRLAILVDGSPADGVGVLLGGEGEEVGLWTVLRGTPDTRPSQGTASLEPWTDDRPREVEIRRAEDLLEVLVDGAVVLEAPARSLSSGAVGLGVLRGAALFDDLRLEAWSPPPADCACADATPTAAWLLPLVLVGPRRRRSQ